MSKLDKIKSIIDKYDIIDIDLSIIQSLDSDKILKLYNLLTQLISLVENNENKFKQFLLKEEINLTLS